MLAPLHTDDYLTWEEAETDEATKTVEQSNKVSTTKHGADSDFTADSPKSKKARRNKATS